MMKADTNVAVDFVARRLPMELIPRRSNLAVRTRLRTLVESRVAPKLFINCVRKGINYNEIVGNRKGSGHSTGGSNSTYLLSSVSVTLLSVAHPVLSSM